ncbi:hypothetical protein CKAN_02248400 [Cinnamomum micranthum f. kanehirae]|uniref:WRKY19-like zinc finger domain-containing protein n=1 Tax=Cinnamomum micranthum f. kanehirae TaxID=337451 RepID=A0A3S3N6E0_9MAGN|nr:hypothetical protein CKAN_02248400 [Cinnamomum micranthum f. kanehirae]
MDNRFQRLGFAANHLSLNAFENLSKVVQVESDYCMDTTLRLDSPSATGLHHFSPKGTKRKWSAIDRAVGLEDGSSLVLGLGCSPSSSDSKGSSATVCTMSSAKETDEESSMDLGLNFHLHLGSEKTPNLTKPAVAAVKAFEMEPEFGLQLSLSTGPSESEITCITRNSTLNNFGTSLTIGKLPVVENGSLSSPLKLRCVVPPPQTAESSFYLGPGSQQADVSPAAPDLSSSVISTPNSSITCTSSLVQQQQRSSNSKNCQFEGCVKGARGASGLCIAHGGGRRCQKAGCHKGAEGRTVYCKAHGGGRRCQHLGCTKSAEGRTDYCIAHGGGRRCSHEGCARAARGKSGLCIRHGGGKRCQKENCTKSAEGFSGLCISHGGGRRCQFTACSKGAQGSTMFCKAHGGGKRCTVLGCTKGAEGSTPFCKGHGGGKRCSFEGGGVCPKSVHGGTLFCVAHGGGKRCAVPECTKSARGRTDFCVRHGGGKRCKHEGCGKSAQGSTDFCKAHGGGKRCSWGHPGSEFRGQAPCDRFARGKTGLCAAHSALVQDHCVHGGGTLGFAQDPQASKSAIDDMNIDIVKTNGMGMDKLASWNSSEPKRQMQPVPAQIQIPIVGTVSSPPSSVSLPEGRVHGGGLMALLAGSSTNQADCGPSDQGRSYMVAHKWM